MKFRVVKNAWWMFWAKGMVFWPFVFMKYRRVNPNPLSAFDRRKAQQDSEWNMRLFRHELEHCLQTKQHGRIGFLLRYLYEWAKCGFSYRKHPMEIAAREVQNNPLTQQEMHWYKTGKIRL